MSTKQQKLTGKKRNNPEEISENDYSKSDENRARYNENYERRTYQSQSSNSISHGNPSKRYETNIKDQSQKQILNKNVYYKKSNFQNASSKTKPDDNYSVSPSRSPSIREANYIQTTSGYNDKYDNLSNNNINYRKSQSGYAANNYNDNNTRNYLNVNRRRDSREFRETNYNRDNQMRNKSYNNYANNEQQHYGHNRNNYDNIQYGAKNYNKSSNRYVNNDYSPENSNLSNSARSRSNLNKEQFNDYSRRSDDYHSKRSTQPNYRSHHQSYDDRSERERYNNDSHYNAYNRGEKQNREKLSERKHTNRRSRSISESSNNSLSRSRYDSHSKDYIAPRSKRNSRDRNNALKRTERKGSSLDRNQINTKNIEENEDNKINEQDVKMKRFNFLMCLPKNYYRFIEKDYGNLYRDIKKKVRELKYLQYTYIVKGFTDNVLRIDANKVSSNAEALRIVCEFIFKEMKQTYQNMTYLKISILVPSHVVGFIIGIEGKNINKIRDSSGAKIDVFHENINNRYRQIELAGSVSSLASAAEQIYRFVNKYYYYNPNQNENEVNDNIKETSKDSIKNEKIRKSANNDNNRNNNYQKNRKERIVLGGENRKLKKREVSIEKHKEENKSERKHRETNRKRYPTDDKYSSVSLSRSKSNREYPVELDLPENFDNYPNTVNNQLEKSQNNALNVISDIEEKTKFLNNQFVEQTLVESIINKNEINQGIETKNSDNAYNASLLQHQQIQQLINSNPQIIEHIPENFTIKQTINSYQNIKSTNELLPENQLIHKEIIKTETINVSSLGNIPETNYINNSNENLNKTENKGKISIDMIVPTKTLNMLKNFQNNIYIEMENKYGCQITKRTEKLANNEEMNILTFNGEPEQNSYALFYLMRHISDIEHK